MGHAAVAPAGSHPVYPSQPAVCLSPGNFNFGFECVDCVAGTFSGGREGRCEPWAE